jgi:Asp/Glu/hydantoin racemase
MGEYRNGDKVNTRYATMRSILIINPNSTEAMTDGLKPLVEMLGFKDVIHIVQREKKKITNQGVRGKIDRAHVLHRAFGAQEHQQ